MNYLFTIISIIFAYFTNFLKKIFKPDPDLRLKFEYDYETSTMRNKIGEFLFTLELSNEFSIFIKNKTGKFEIMHTESDHRPGIKIFYGLPIISNGDSEIIITSYDDDIVFHCKDNRLIPYKEILEKL